jgi:hypothetical protein
MEAICHAYPGNQKTRVTEKDIEECIFAARKLLGPYAGINASFFRTEDLPDDLSGLVEDPNDIRSKSNNDEKKNDASVKRPFGYNSSQIKYEKQIAAAMEYYNKLYEPSIKYSCIELYVPHTYITMLIMLNDNDIRRKSGEKNLATPQKIFKEIKESLRKNAMPNKKKTMNQLSAVEDTKDLRFTNNTRFSEYAVDFDQHDERLGTTVADNNNSTAKSHIHKAYKRKFDVNNVTEQDYMDFYLHYAGSEEDVSIKKPVQSLTDVAKVRKQMHLDNSLEIDDAETAELMKNDSFSDLHDPIARRFVKGQTGTNNPIPLSDEEAEDAEEEDYDIVSEIIRSHYDKIKSPHLKEMYTKYVNPEVFALKTMEPSPALSDAEMDPEQVRREEMLELELGFGVDDEDLEMSGSGIERPRTSFATMSPVSSDTDASTEDHRNSNSAAIPGQECNVRDVKCLEETGALGIRPFITKIFYGRPEREDSLLRVHDSQNEKLDFNIFSIEHWKKK